MKEQLVALARLVDRNDARMVDRRGQLRLAQETLAEGPVLGQAGGEHLERHLPLQAQVLGQVDDAHAALAEQRFDPVSGELRSDPRVVLHLHVPFFFFFFFFFFFKIHARSRSEARVAVFMAVERRCTPVRDACVTRL